MSRGGVGGFVLPKELGTRRPRLFSAQEPVNLFLLVWRSRHARSPGRRDVENFVRLLQGEWRQECEDRQSRQTVRWVWSNDCKGRRGSV